jgi:hypothetical protein
LNMLFTRRFEASGKLILQLAFFKARFGSICLDPVRFTSMDPEMRSPGKGQRSNRNQL